MGSAPVDAPSGRYLGRVVHVEPNWTYFQNRKVAVYLEVAEGPHAGKRARKFYRLRRRFDGEFEIAPGSNLLDDIRRLFPDEDISEGVDVVRLFFGRFFDMDVQERFAKDGTPNSIVTEIYQHDPGF